MDNETDPVDKQDVTHSNHNLVLHCGRNHIRVKVEEIGEREKGSNGLDHTEDRFVQVVRDGTAIKLHPFDSYNEQDTCHHVHEEQMSRHVLDQVRQLPKVSVELQCVVGGIDLGIISE